MNTMNFVCSQGRPAIVIPRPSHSIGAAGSSGLVNGVNHNRVGVDVSQVLSPGLGDYGGRTQNSGVRCLYVLRTAPCFFNAAIR